MRDTARASGDLATARGATHVQVATAIDLIVPCSFKSLARRFPVGHVCPFALIVGRFATVPILVVVRIALIGVIVKIRLIRAVVRVVLIGVSVKLLLGVCLARNAVSAFAHLFFSFQSS